MGIGRLDALLAGMDEVRQLRKLQTTFFIAQMKTGITVYRFRVRKGKVVSDELDQDLAQMTAAGLVHEAVGIQDRRPEWRFREEKGSQQWVGVEKDFRNWLITLNRQRVELLEVAATSEWFRNHGRLDRMSKLSWVSKVSSHEWEEVEQLLESKVTESGSVSQL